MKKIWLFSFALFLSVHTSLAAELPLVEKQVFTTTDFVTFGGETIAEVQVGWEAYGQLNEQKDNVILVTHFFSGNSHAAGKYSADDPQAGYWDALIGPGKTIDTNKFYVISVDTLVNQEPHNPNVTTTGPASINPATGKPYGLDFPVVTIRDFVNVQKLVLESLGIERLHAVIGASMGSLQALEWAVTYPDQVERLIHVIGMAEADPWTIANLQQWAQPILLDQNWNGGDYYGGEAPQQGLQTTLGMITLGSLHPRIVNQLYAATSARESAPLQDIRNNFSIVEQLRGLAAMRAQYADANHVLYLIRANQLFLAGMGETLDEGLARVEAKTLVLPAANDLLLQPYLSERLYQLLQEHEKDVTFLPLEGDWGHLDGVYGVMQHHEIIKEFLNE
ncbi:E22 family MetX-like putative esterase [Aliidiomarina haloalkalitolerans]|uniref:Probable acyltransferase n=1 Tax=Aliidiomarina haloalkalitolerans TaxID=859059 RepID=A0A432VRA7_9GAMM|nr:homoserine O-acetyltransferase [Aliidiomarina haloalkalitolerans]RUO18848.1 homoserine acetyltransferase [Aliidiomarina haloalkalitolerans]